MSPTLTDAAIAAADPHDGLAALEKRGSTAETFGIPLAVLAEQTGMGIPIVVLPAVSGPLASRPQFARSVKTLRAEGVSILLGTPPPASGEADFPWHLALDEAAEMTGFGAA